MLPRHKTFKALLLLINLWRLYWTFAIYILSIARKIKMHHQHHFEQHSNDTSVYVSAVFAERLSNSFLITPLTVIIVWNLFEK